MPLSGCGRELVPDEWSGGSSCRRTCACVDARIEYAASDQDLVSMGNLLKERGLPRRWAGLLLTSLADCKTTVEVIQGDGSQVVVSYDDARAAIGHDFDIT